MHALQRLPAEERAACACLPWHCIGTAGLWYGRDCEPRAAVWTVWGSRWCGRWQHGSRSGGTWSIRIRHGHIYLFSGRSTRKSPTTAGPPAAKRTAQHWCTTTACGGPHNCNGRLRCGWQSLDCSAACCAVQVLPHFVCYCDQDWYASVLRRCRVDGSDLQAPFRCPLDVLLNPASLDAAGLPYRVAAYLVDPRAPAVARGEERVVMHGDAAWVEFMSAHGTGGGGWVTAGVTGEEVRAQLGRLQGVGVLRVEGLRPGGFGGWSRSGESAAFDRAFAAAVGQDASWCCSCDSSPTNE